MARISSGVLLLTGMISLMGSLNAQTTCAGTQDFSGPYVFTASRLAFFPASTTPPGTTTTGPVFVPQPTAAPGTTGEYSMTAIGRLIGNSSNASPFSGVGRVYADGAGVLYAQRGTEPANIRIGTYTVTTECQISMTISDVFATDANAANRPAVTYVGALTDRGGEATLAQTTQGAGTLISFSRPFLAAGCSQSSLGGRYGISGIGVMYTPMTNAPPGTTNPGTTTPGTTNPGTTTPGTTAAPAPGQTSPLVFASTFTADAGVVGSALSASTGSGGSYTVNPDCTGSLTLISADKATTQRFAFVLTGTNNVTGVNNSPQTTRPSVRLVLDGPGQFAGIAEAR
jgi:hypothetical protein